MCRGGFSLLFNFWTTPTLSSVWVSWIVYIEQSLSKWTRKNSQVHILLSVWGSVLTRAAVFLTPNRALGDRAAQWGLCGSKKSCCCLLWSLILNVSVAHHTVRLLSLNSITWHCDWVMLSRAAAWSNDCWLAGGTIYENMWNTSPVIVSCVWMSSGCQIGGLTSSDHFKTEHSWPLVAQVGAFWEKSSRVQQSIYRDRSTFSQSPSQAFTSSC